MQAEERVAFAAAWIVRSEAASEHEQQGHPMIWLSEVIVTTLAADDAKRDSCCGASCGSTARPKIVLLTATRPIGVVRAERLVTRVELGRRRAPSIVRVARWVLWVEGQPNDARRAFVG